MHDKTSITQGSGAVQGISWLPYAPSSSVSIPQLTRSSLRRELLLPAREQAAGGAGQDEDGQHPGQARTERQDQHPCRVACLGPDEAPQDWPEGHAHTIPDVLPAVQGTHGGVAIVLAINHGEDGHLPPHTNAEQDGKEEERPGILRKEEEKYREGLHAETARHDLFAPDVVRHDRHCKPCHETAGIEGGIDASGQTRREAMCHGDRR